MKNHRFPWLRNRTTDNRKCEKARNIKEKCTIEMFNTVLRKLVELHSLASVNQKETYLRTKLYISNAENNNVLGIFLSFLS